MQLDDLVLVDRCFLVGDIIVPVEDLNGESGVVIEVTNELDLFFTEEIQVMFIKLTVLIFRKRMFHHIIASLSITSTSAPMLCGDNVG